MNFKKKINLYAAACMFLVTKKEVYRDRINAIMAEHFGL